MSVNDRRPPEGAEWKEGLWRAGEGARLRFVLGAAVVLAVVAALLFVGWSPAAAIAGAALALLGFAWPRGQHRRALARSGAVELAADDGDRLRNIAHGVAGELGIDPPRLLVIEEGGPNALVTGGPSPALAVTRSAIETLTRTETEAMVAHCLVRLATGRVDVAARGAAFGRLAWAVAEPVGESDDLRAASLTRYPPALQSAIDKAGPRSGRDAPFWFVGKGPSHRSAAERARALADL